MDTDTIAQPQEYDADKEAQAMWERAQAFLPKEGEEAPKVEEKQAPAEPEPAKEEVKQDEPDKKVEENSDIPEDFPKNSKATPEAIGTWKDMKAELKQLREERDNLKNTLPEKDKTVQEKMLEIEEMRKKIAEFEGKDISAYEKRIAEMESKLGEQASKLGEHEKFLAIHDVAKSDAYKQEILEPSAAIGQALEVLAGANDVDAETLIGVLRISDPVEQRKKLREVTEGWHPTDAAELMEHARNTQALLKKSSEMLENADKAKKEIAFMEQEKARKAKEDEEKQLMSATEAANKLIQEKIPFLKDNKELLEAVQKAEIKKDPASMAVAARASVILPHLLRQLDERNAKIAELETSLKSRIAASPRPSSSQTPTSTKDDLPTGYDVDSIMARFQAHQRQQG